MSRMYVFFCKLLNFKICNAIVLPSEILLHLWIVIEHTTQNIGLRLSIQTTECDIVNVVPVLNKYIHVSI